MPRGKGKKTLQIEEAVQEALATSHPATLRQCFYALVSRQAIENTERQYESLGRILVQMRKSGSVPWEWIEDRTRQPHMVAMWDGLEGFGGPGRRKKGCPGQGQPFTDAPTLTELSISRNESSKAQRIATLPPEQFASLAGGPVEHAREGL